MMSVAHAKINRGFTSDPISRAPAPWAATVAGFALCLLTAVAGCRTAPIQDIVDATLPGACPEATPQDVDEAIWRAGRKAGWEVERLQPGVLRGTWRFKRYRAVVSIAEAGGRVSIRYQDSENLLHEGGRIHHSYNQLVARLLGRIQQEPVRLGSDAVCPGSAGSG